MTIPNESYVGVAVDGAGKKIRNLSITALQPDGTPVLVQMQVVAIADDQGAVIDVDTKPLIEEMLLEQRRTNTLLEVLASCFGGGIDSAVVEGLIAATRLGPPAPPTAPINAVGDPFGRQIIVPWGARDLFVPGFSGTITDTAAHTLIAGVNDTYLDLVGLVIVNTSASTNSRVDVSDGTNTYPFMSIGGSQPVGFMSGLVLPASNKGVAWTITAASAVTDLRAWALFVRNR